MEILPGIHVVPGVNWSRTYLIEGETLALVDSGLPWNGGHALRYIGEIGRRPDEVSHLLVTHAHPDHTGSARRLARETGARVAAHAADTRGRDGRARLGYMGLFGALPGPVPFLGRVPVTEPVEEGDVLPIGAGVRVIHTPGHTAGSVCYLDEGTGTLFSGDTIFSDGQRISRSVPFPGYDAEGYRASLERLAGLDFEAVCGGHGAPLISGGAGALRDLLARRPALPTWRGFFRSIPRRIRDSRGVKGEEF